MHNIRNCIELMLCFCFSTDHNEGSVPDAEEDAAIPEGAQQGKSVYVCSCTCYIRSYIAKEGRKKPREALCPHKDGSKIVCFVTGPCLFSVLHSSAASWGLHETLPRNSGQTVSRGTGENKTRLAKKISKSECDQNLLNNCIADKCLLKCLHFVDVRFWDCVKSCMFVCLRIWLWAQTPREKRSKTPWGPLCPSCWMLMSARMTKSASSCSTFSSRMVRRARGRH